MKHYFILSLLAFAVLGITSCQDMLDEANGFSTSMDNSIQVNAMIGNSAVTRASGAPTSSETTTDLLKTDDGGFNLFAWQGVTADNKTIIPATTFSWSDTDSKFVENGSSTAHYWPEGIVKFWAYAVDNKSVESGLPTLDSADSKDTFTKSYTVSAETQDDPVLAYTAQHKHADDNYVNLTFQHLLSRVSVNACAPYFTNGYVRLLSFGFTSVGTSGTFTYQPTFNVAASTNAPFDASCWANTTETDADNIGAHTSNDNLAVLWYTAGTAEDDADNEGYNKMAAWAAGDGPVVPVSSASNTARLSYTSGDNTVTVPWLNVIPGSDVAETLVITYEYYYPEKDNGNGNDKGGWVTKVATVDIPKNSVPAKHRAVQQISTTLVTSTSTMCAFWVRKVMTPMFSRLR